LTLPKGDRRSAPWGELKAIYGAEYAELVEQGLKTLSPSKGMSGFWCPIAKSYAEEVVVGSPLRIFIKRER